MVTYKQRIIRLRKREGVSLEFNYNKLKGKIKEVYGTQQEFAKALGISSTTLNTRLKNETFFNQSEIEKTRDLLNLKSEQDIIDIFFTAR